MSEREVINPANTDYSYYPEYLDEVRARKKRFIAYARGPTFNEQSRSGDPSEEPEEPELPPTDAPGPLSKKPSITHVSKAHKRGTRSGDPSEEPEEPELPLTDAPGPRRAQSTRSRHSHSREEHLKGTRKNRSPAYRSKKYSRFH